MNLSFLHYKLNTEFNLLQSQLALQNKLDDVLLYKVVDLPIKFLIIFSIRNIALYFYENNLVTVFYTLDAQYTDWEKVVLYFEDYFKKQSTMWEEDEGNVYNWEYGNIFLGIVANPKENSITVYYTLQKYNVFEN